MSRQEELHTQEFQVLWICASHPHLSVLFIGISINMENFRHYEASSQAVLYSINRPSQRDRHWYHSLFYEETEAQR